MHSPRVLVVDDEADVRQMVAWVLQRARYTVSTAKDGRLALAMLDRVAPHIVLLDAAMPVMSGAEFIHQVRLRGHGAPPPFGVVTMSGRVPAARSPTRWFLAKPLSEALLLGVVSDFCARFAASPPWVHEQRPSGQMSPRYGDHHRPSSP